MLHLVVVIRTLGVLLLVYSVAIIPPLLISVGYQDGEWPYWLIIWMEALLLGWVMWWPLRRRELDLHRRDGFTIVTLFWFILGFISAVPFLFMPQLDFSDAVFEAISAFTTTGATVIVGLDQLPPSILFWRQELQWLGGIGVIVTAVAILPMLGIGGMQLYRAETPGPIKGEKLTPRIAQTARALWFIYGGLTITCATAYWLAGMSWFDAVAHSLTTVSTGGFSTHDDSLAYFDSALIEAIACLFMLLGAINFGIHYLALHKGRIDLYWRQDEIRIFLKVVAILIALIAATLFLSGTYTHPLTALRYAAFQTISVITSTGYGTADFSLWPLFLPVLLIFSSFMGGCAGSTAGGMKVIRFLLLVKQGRREIYRLVHPQIVRTLKIDGRPVAEEVTSAVWGFFSLYILLFAILMMVLMAYGMDQVTAFGAVATCLNNLGPGLGEVATNFIGVSDGAKWLLSFAMLAGRLELFTVLVLFSRIFWRS
ncbi:TrkH family potassium uptake protein [Nitrosococcus wardiae]|uniref:Trk system potassium uptake protein n=1 Tax=Nitrosococcus wardiae TaxID=1814290 RepID=A0A4P7C0Q0_9GAMM|nr:TrkH family potassium uptake protein [Nitrosococcus wardiae]QBQ54974.1 potassium transporter [Nitrosococcus wardiae]